MGYASFTIGGTIRSTSHIYELISRIEEVSGEAVAHIARDIALSWKHLTSVHTQSDYDDEACEELENWLNDHTLPYSKYGSHDSGRFNINHNYDGTLSEFWYAEDDDGEAVISIYALKEMFGKFDTAIPAWIRQVEQPCPPLVLIDEAETWGAVELAKLAHGIAA